MSFIPASKIVSSTPNGTNAAPGLTFSNDSDTGLYDISDGVLGITNNGALSASFNASHQLDMNSHKIINVLDPTGNQDVATKTYVDSVAAGLDVKAAVRVATTGNLSVTAAGSQVGKTLTATANGAISIDGVSLSLNDRVLVKNQTTTTDNGIYTVTTVGTAGTPYVLTRATDFDGSPSNEVQGGDFCFVEAGTQVATGWTVIANGSIVVDTNPITWTQFNAASAYTADETTLHLSGTQFSIKTGFSPIQGANGSAAAPTYTFSSTPTTGLYTLGDNSIRFSIAGTQKWIFDSNAIASPDGSVGSPSHTFSADTGTGMYRIGASDIGFAVGGTKVLDLTNGTVTVTGNASENLHVLSSSASGVDIRFLASGTTEAWIQTQSNHPLKFTTNNATAAIMIDTSQKVGINTTNTSGNYQMRIDATNRLGVSIVSTASGSAAYLNLENDVANIWDWANNGSGTANPSKLSLQYNGTDMARWSTTGQLTTYNSSAASISTGVRIVNPNNTAGTGASLELVQRPNEDYKWRIASIAQNGTPNSLDPKFLISVDDGAGSYTDVFEMFSGGGDINAYFTANTNAQHQFSWRNAGTGYGSFTAVNTPLGHALQVGVTGSGATGNYVTNGPAAADIAYIQAAGNASGLALNTTIASSISFATNNTLRLQLTQTALIFSADCVPSADITNDNGNSTHRWLNIWGQNIHAGDVVLDNGWAITEGDKVGRNKDEVLLKSPDGRIFKFLVEEIV